MITFYILGQKFVKILGFFLENLRFRKDILKSTDLSKTVAYLGFEITGANLTFSPVFLIDRFLYAVSYKPILSVIDLIKYTYQQERKFLFLEPNNQIKKSILNTIILRVSAKEIFAAVFLHQRTE